MKNKNRGLDSGLVLLACATLASTAKSESVAFDWFEYRGHDAVFELPLAAGEYRNPVLAGFHPDPSITRAGDKFYLVNSTFTFFPGIAVFESVDLVHWRQIGNVIARPSQLDFDGLGVSRGVFAPAIEFHAGTFYVLNTAVDSGGNFISTAKDAAGPWSDPVWLPGIDGIDPSLFIDKDGAAYVLNNGLPQGEPLYEGHRAIWIQQFDLAALQPVGPRRVLVNGGVDISKQPIWIEGPHIYARGGWYYLSCAEGGTGPNHSQVVLRARSPWGPFVAYQNNPILTQRDLPAGRAHPITNAGHADLVEAPDGSWWAIFLATRTYGDSHYNTGRETFLLPIAWKDGWPVILGRGQAIPYVNRGPRMLGAGDQAPLSGNFIWRDEFEKPSLNPAWLFVRVPKKAWADLRRQPGSLVIDPLPEPLDGLGNPSFLGRRQQHIAFDATTALGIPASGTVVAGLAAFQGEGHWYFFGARRAGERTELTLQKKSGADVQTIAKTVIDARGRMQMRIAGEGAAYSFYFNAGGEGWQSLKENDDAAILSTKVAGGFVGVVVGPYARVDAP